MHTTLVRPADCLAGVTRCSPYDSMLRYVVCGMAFCYRERLNPVRLRESLALVLRDFGSFSGTFFERQGGSWIEHCTSAVPFEECESAEPCRVLGKLAAAHVKQSEQLFPKLPVASNSVLRSRGQAPLMGARLTQTPDGSVLGLTWIHTAGDMQTGMLFMRAWARAYRGEAYPKPILLADPLEYLSAHVPHFADGTAMHVASWPEWFRTYRQFLKPALPRRVNLSFTWEELDAMHAAVAGDRPVTVHDALCAHVFATIRKLNGAGKKSLLRLSLNFRQRLKLPGNLLGNFVDGVSMQVDRGHGVAQIAADLRDELETFPKRPLLHREFARLGAESSAWAKQIRYVEDGIDPSSLGLSLLMVTWARFGIYNLMFETTKPVYVHCRPTEYFNWYAFVYDSPDQAGLSVRAWLPAKLATGLVLAKQRSLVAECS